MMRTTSLILGLALMTPTICAGDLTDPVEILKKVDAAAKAVKGAKYDITVEGTGAMASRIGKLTASVIMTGYSGNTPEKYFVDAKITLPNTDKPRRISAGSDNDMFYIVDHQGKIAYEDLDPAVMGQAGRGIRMAWTLEFTHPNPFSDELNGQSQELKGSEIIGGEDCYIVHVVYAGTQAATWSFSKKDFLPRRRIDHRNIGGESGTTVRTMTNLVVDPKVDDAVFKLKLPEGYTKTDDFAPNFLAPPNAPPQP